MNDPTGAHLEDRQGRKIEYLRLSVTNRCNLTCSYCMPVQGVPTPRTELLTTDELLRLCAILVPRGIKKIRLTGGEPLMREDLTVILKGIRKVAPSAGLSMTTNGTLLKGKLEELKEAGLKRLNISLDTLRPEKFEKISGEPLLQTVFESIEEILAKKMFQLKVNVLLMGGTNDDEIEDFIEFVREKPVELRFIEMMPFAQLGGRTFVPSRRILEILMRRYGIRNGRRGRNRTALTYSLEGFAGKVGLISPLTRPFCKDCNRLRITASGNILSCLLGGSIHNVRTPMRNGSSDEEILAIIREGVSEKPIMPGRDLLRHHGPLRRCMTAIGG